MTGATHIKNLVRANCRVSVKQVTEGRNVSCYGPSACRCGTDPITDDELRPGETVLDLASGRGIEFPLSARRVLKPGRRLAISDAVRHVMSSARVLSCGWDVSPGHWRKRTTEPSSEREGLAMSTSS